MRYVRQFMQKTIKADDPKLFDEMVNSVYLKAATSGKEPSIHYYDGMGFCASVTFYISQQIAENTKDEYELTGDYHYCTECPEFELPKDKRIRHIHCNKGHAISCDSIACVYYYDMLKGGLLDGLPK